LRYIATFYLYIAIYWNYLLLIKYQAKHCTRWTLFNVDFIGCQWHLCLSNSDVHCAKCGSLRTVQDEREAQRWHLLFLKVFLPLILQTDVLITICHSVSLGLSNTKRATSPFCFQIFQSRSTRTFLHRIKRNQKKNV
jgi:hypothetical protein